MTYDEYIAQQQQAIDEEQQEDSCFLAARDTIISSLMYRNVSS